jgi:hypothetical protein
LLARNLFCGYMFGRVVDNTEGSFALWLTWVMSALGEQGIAICRQVGWAAYVNPLIMADRVGGGQH